jgi:hypothetical protein
MSDTFEVNKEIEVTPMMQLVDLNGTKVNFQSEFTVSTDPSKKIGIAIVSQEQLDNGDIRFEPIEEGGTYSRRITYQKNAHQNHFIALKKLDKDETPVTARVIVRLKELPFLHEEPRPEPRQERNIPRDIDTKGVFELRDRAFEEQPAMRNDIQKKLSSLSKREDYAQSPDSREYTPSGRLNIDNENLSNRVSNVSNVSNQHTKPEMTFSDRIRYDPYYLVGIVCIVLFVAILFSKFNLSRTR